MPVGAELRAARTRAGLSLAELGQLVGVSAATLSRWETGRVRPTADALRRSAAVLDLDPQVWLGASLALSDAAPRSAQTGGQPDSPLAGNWRRYDALTLDPVLAAALDSFLRLGYHGTSVREVARVAGMSVPNLYHYYPSKQALLVAIMDLTMSEFGQRCEQARAEGPDAAERFRRLVECFALFHSYRRELAFIGASEMRSLESPERLRIARIRNDCQHKVDHELATLASQGRLQTTHFADAGRAVSTMLVGIASWYRSDGTQRPEDIAQVYVDLASSMVGLTA